MRSALPLRWKLLIRFSRTLWHRLSLFKLHFLRFFSKGDLPTFLIDVCIPAYGSAQFIHETLHALQKQTYPHFRAHISVDGNDRSTYDACLPFLSDKRFSLTLQEKRLGWVQNTNWLIAQGNSPYLFLLPHDDLPHPLLFQELVHHMTFHPSCALVYSDAESFSSDSSHHHLYFAQPSIKGPLFQRMDRYLRQNYDSVGYRSLILRPAIPSLLEKNAYDDLAEDTLWVGKIALKGELHRLPYPLYQKRYHANNESVKWMKQSREDYKKAISFHCTKLLDLFLEETKNQEEREVLQQAAMKRLARWRLPKES